MGVNAVKIVADDQIPYVSELFGDFGEIVRKPGAVISHEDVVAADVLLTRTVTRVDASLLNNTAVKFVGSATAGCDHLDQEWLRHAGILCCYAPGVNANAVAEYVVSCVAQLSIKKLLPEKSHAGIIGLGHVGASVEKKLSALGFKVVYNDPPRAQQESDFHSTPLAEFYNLDLICISVPLTKTTEFTTYHLLDKLFLSKLKPGCIVLNTARGAVIDNHALRAAEQVIACLDVWEHEPHINLNMLKRAEIATPHIAGYSRQAKFKATYTIYEKFIRHFSLNDIHHNKSFDQLNNNIKLCVPSNADWRHVVLQAFNSQRETEQMKNSLLSDARDTAKKFAQLRHNYQLRNEFSSFNIKNTLPQTTLNILKKLGFK